MEYSELLDIWWISVGGGFLLGFGVGSVLTLAVLHYIAKAQSEE